MATNNLGNVVTSSALLAALKAQAQASHQHPHAYGQYTGYGPGYAPTATLQDPLPYQPPIPLRDFIVTAVEQALIRVKATWLLCDGRAVRIDHYPELFEVVCPNAKPNSGHDLFCLPSVSQAAYIKAKPDNTPHKLGSMTLCLKHSRADAPQRLTAGDIE